MLTLRDRLELQQAGLAQGLERLYELPHRRSYLRLIHELGNRLLRVQREWLDDVKKELRHSE